MEETNNNTQGQTINESKQDVLKNQSVRQEAKKSNKRAIIVMIIVVVLVIIAVAAAKGLPAVGTKKQGSNVLQKMMTGNVSDSGRRRGDMRVPSERMAPPDGGGNPSSGGSAGKPAD